MYKGMKMDSRNTKSDGVVKHESVEIKAERSDVRVLNLDLVEPEGLELADDPDLGSDPYNSTGQHVIIKPKTNLED